MIMTPKNSIDKSSTLYRLIVSYINCTLFLIYRSDVFRTSKSLPSSPNGLVEAVHFVLNCDILRILMTYDYKIYNSITFLAIKVLGAIFFKINYYYIFRPPTHSSIFIIYLIKIICDG